MVLPLNVYNYSNKKCMFTGGRNRLTHQTGGRNRLTHQKRVAFISQPLSNIPLSVNTVHAAR